MTTSHPTLPYTNVPIIADNSGIRRANVYPTRTTQRISKPAYRERTSDNILWAYALRSLYPSQKSIYAAIALILVFFAAIGFGVYIASLLVAGVLTFTAIVSLSVLVISVLLGIQSLFTLAWMLYAWEDPIVAENNKSPKTFAHPQTTFTALIPARHEDRVIADTIHALNRTHYPENLKEMIILCRDDDIKTIAKVRETIALIGKDNIKLHIFNSFPINKPHALNAGLKVANNEVIVIFDAEDEPHPDILNVANTVFVKEGVDVLQSGVQLMNFKSHWFSALNCMEYYFWFKSGLHFFSKVGQATPLGGNSVFFKKHMLEEINGWDEGCLTEDADVGFRLLAVGAKVRVIYDEVHATREETPSTIKEFVKQRTRWNQGFLQIISKGSWLLPKKRQKVTLLYILVSPAVQALMLLYIPVALWVAFTVKMPVLISLFSFFPIFVLGLQITTQIIGLYQFTTSYRLKFPWYMPIKVVVTYLPYQALLMVSAVRALYRFSLSLNTWEKTSHINAHRKAAGFTYAN